MHYKCLIECGLGNIYVRDVLLSIIAVNKWNVKKVDSVFTKI